MLLNLKVDNYKGVKNEINISSIASNKIKRSSNETSKICNNIKLLKNICLIGSNASGKTSILNAIETLQDFLMFPYRKKITNEKDYADFIENMSPEELKKFLIKFNTLQLGEQNNLRKNEKTIIEIELYIPKRKNNIPGIYKYTLIYKDDYYKNGVLMEKLEYKKSINTKSKIISLRNNIIESEIGTAILYENNDNKSNENSIFIDYFKTFFEEMIDYTSCIDKKAGINLHDIVKNNKEQLIALTNIADEKIINISIDENNDKQQILFWNSKSTKLTFSQLSSGTKKIIILGSILLESLENNSLVLIDEIELSLHPSLAMFLINLNISKDCNHFSQLIFTTHSPFVAFSLSNDQLYYINNKNDQYSVSNINSAIKNGIITKDKNPQRAWLEDLLIKNPDTNKISNFLKNNKGN